MTWEQRGELGGPPEALLPTDGVLYAAAEDVGVLESRDSGDSWSVRYAE